jgi:hypothetical protein
VKYRNKFRRGSPPCNRLSKHPRGIRVKVTLVARPLLTQVAQKLCTCEHDVFMSKTCVCSRKLLRIKTVCCCSRSIKHAYFYKEVPNKTKISWLVTESRGAENVIALLEENEGDCWFEHVGRSPRLGMKLLYCRSSLVCALFAVSSGHRSLQTSRCQTCFCRDFSEKEFTVTTQKA